MARPKFNPTAEQSRLVRTLSAYGIPQEHIARRVGLRSPKTLRKHFRKVLDDGIFEANCNVIQTLYQMATSGEHLAATLFWSKCRCHWRERSTSEPGFTVPPFIVAKEPGGNN